jgi:tetrahydromethanopterin S-methyltransferase subunit G
MDQIASQEPSRENIELDKIDALIAEHKAAMEIERQDYALLNSDMDALEAKIEAVEGELAKQILDIERADEEIATALNTDVLDGISVGAITEQDIAEWEAEH